MENTYRLVASCPDCVGIVARVTRFVADQGGWLVEASYHSDEKSGWFFMRTEIKSDSLSVTREQFGELFQKEVAGEFGMSWSLSDSSEKQRVVLLASHASHCLAELLYRWHSEDIHCEVVAVISNHDNLREMTEWYGVPFHHVPVDPSDKAAHFAEVDRLIENYQGETVVLARYMQVIPSHLCEKYLGRMINIHHSFLPSFVGANPYQAAYDRGVKLIGATCHYVTEDLDQGPIIEQEVVRVSHRHAKSDLVRLGKDVEKLVLARGLRYHLEQRVAIHGNKTVVFD